MRLFAAVLVVAITSLAVVFPAEAAIGVAIGGLIIAPVAVVVLRSRSR